MGNKLTNLLLIILLILVLILLLRKNSVIEINKEGKIDTIFVLQKPNDTIRIEKKKILKKILFDTITVKDTIILKPNFELKIDTIITKDTIKLFYTYPKDSLFIEIKKKPETTLIIEKHQMNINQKKEKFFEKENLLFLGSFIFGVVVGLIVK